MPTVDVCWRYQAATRSQSPSLPRLCALSALNKLVFDILTPQLSTVSSPTDEISCQVLPQDQAAKPLAHLSSVPLMWHILQLRVRVVPVDMGELGMGWLWLLGITKPDTSIPKNSSELYNTIICIVQGIVAVGLLSLDREDDWLCHDTTQTMPPLVSSTLGRHQRGFIIACLLHRLVAFLIAIARRFGLPMASAASSKTSQWRTGPSTR